LIILELAHCLSVIDIDCVSRGIFFIKWVMCTKPFFLFGGILTPLSVDTSSTMAWPLKLMSYAKQSTCYVDLSSLFSRVQICTTSTCHAVGWTFSSEKTDPTLMGRCPWTSVR
jgi:hypothetical protein